VLQSKLYSQKSTLVYPNINFSEISNLDELQEGLSVFNSLNQINDDRYQILINKINVETAFLNSIYLMEPSVINYRNALIWYLEIKAGIFPDQNRINDIKTLANDCEENGSPGSKLAKLLCKSLRLEYNDSECNDVEGRVNLNDENSDKFKIWPNPTNGIINIESNSYLDVIEIFSVYGIKVSDAIILSDNKIDVSYLEPGIYILRPKGQSNVIKFIKID
jgi:hypothetical protein